MISIKDFFSNNPKEWLQDQRFVEVFEISPYDATAGAYLGFPYECIKSFCEFSRYGKRDYIDTFSKMKNHPMMGTGYVPSIGFQEESQYDSENFISLINEARVSKRPFPEAYEVEFGYIHELCLALCKKHYKDPYNDLGLGFKDRQNLVYIHKIKNDEKTYLHVDHLKVDVSHIVDFYNFDSDFDFKKGLEKNGAYLELQYAFIIECLDKNMTEANILPYVQKKLLPLVQKGNFSLSGKIQSENKEGLFKSLISIKKFKP
jgi:hypothetical protein